MIIGQKYKVIINAGHNYGTHKPEPLVITGYHNGYGKYGSKLRRYMFYSSYGTRYIGLSQEKFRRKDIAAITIASVQAIKKVEDYTKNYMYDYERLDDGHIKITIFRKDS